MISIFKTVNWNLKVNLKYFAQCKVSKTSMHAGLCICKINFPRVEILESDQWI